MPKAKKIYKKTKIRSDKREQELKVTEHTDLTYSGINWFPGHMTKALREMEKEIKNVDLLFYCLDSRAPISCLNPKLTSLAKSKQIIYILTKADMVSSQDIERFKRLLSAENVSVISINSTQSRSGKILFSLSNEIMKEKISSKLDKGITYSLKAMVVGVPNVGKSTLINNLCAQSKTITGNKPGVTRGKQWVVTKEGLTLLDTPGTLWPSFEDTRVACNLAYIGSIKDDVLELTELCFSFLKDIREKYSKNLEDRYGITITEETETLQIFEDICSARKCILRGCEPDYERCARLIIDDFRKGRLGKIVLD